ncbi:MAG: bifunctional proline dehydrogenase/L-glutamate gamma-semialdehyde dehydrogenase [Bifidobacteriaceae bacterium]|nr:bifunctional proline dehydrogenase/L-glutamate gamma-semialdehyde dehydrogenase [Bifidobacteriaceae bacterium]
MTSKNAKSSPTVTPDQLVEEAVKLARQWSRATDTKASAKELASNRMLAKLVQDKAGLEFTMAFVDRVARPEDNKVAARELKKLATSGNVPGFISVPDRCLTAVGGRIAPLMPAVAMPLARARLRQMVGHLVVDASDKPLTKHIERSKQAGYRLNLNLLGEAVLGEKEAAKRLARTIALVRRRDVDYISIKVSSLASQLVTWDRAGSVERILDHLHPLLRAAKESGTFVNLDMEEYRDLNLTMDAFERAMMEEEFLHLEAGIVIQCYLPDALGAMQELAAFALRRQAAGGAPIKVRLVKGANLSMEQVECQLHGWEQAIYPSKEAVDANYVRVIDWAVRPENVQNLKIGVAGHNLFHLALAHLLAERRGVSSAVDFEMLQGMAPAQADAVKQTTGSVLFYTPVVAAEDFDVAIAYLVRRLEENAAPQNFLHQSFAPVPDPLAIAEEKFRLSVQEREKYSLEPRRGKVPAPPEQGFYNEPDSDAAVQAQRDVALAALAATPPTQAVAELTDVAELDGVIVRAVEAHPKWAGLTPTERATALRAAAGRLAAQRSALLNIMAHEGGKTVAEADPEISEAIDFARYYAESAIKTAALGERDRLTFTPSKVTAVIPPWNFPVAIPVGGVMAALAAGSPVVIKPAKATRRCVEVAVAAILEGLAEAGAPDGILQVVHVANHELGRRLVTHPDVETVVLTGSIETAAMFADWRPELNLLAETSGKNSIIVTPSADLDLAASDLVKSAFGHAGQKCSAASLGILVGSVYRSRRFLGQLADAVRSLAVGQGPDIATTMGPLIEPPSEKLHRALTKLDPGERWLVKPQQLDDSGRLWSPGLKAGVEPGSWYHLTECFGPVLGLMYAKDLSEAIALQNATSFGLTGGIHTLDQGEVARWLDLVEVGNAYVNRHITGAIVQRQSFGGWKASAVGPGAKAGGPNYVAEFGVWADAEPPADPDAWLEAARRSDAAAWAEEFGLDHDPSALRVEANRFRYRPVPVYTVRVGEGGAEHQVQRVLAAASLAGVPATVSRWGAETHEEFARSVRTGIVSGRIRVVGRSPGLREAAAARLGEVTVLDQPVTGAGRRELLNVLHEQALSITKHRFGHVPD